MPETRKRISRRKFLQLAGVGGVAMAAGATQPALQTNPRHALDAAGRASHPWWVRTVDKPTVEFNWDQIKRFDSRSTVRSGFAKYVGEERVEYLSKVAADNERRRLQENVSGYTLKDLALRGAVQIQLEEARVSLSFLGPRRALTPEERGVPQWAGSPEESARVVRAAMRHFGAAKAGFIELDDNTRKLIYSHDPDGKQIIFEDVSDSYETETRRVIANKAKWVIVYAVQMSGETLRRAPTVIAEQSTALSYARGAFIQNQTQEFIRGLGYQCVGGATVNALGIAPAFGVLAGLGELSRLNRLITPEYGPMVRLFFLITDLPLAVDKPIDAGIMEFCRHCKKCAEACPPAALSFDDEPTWNTRGQWNNAGHKAYFEDSVKCMTYWREKAGTNCGICFAVCPFSKKDKAWIHSVAKASIATVPALNGFVRSMDDAFSYGAQKDLEGWWSLDLPEYGIDTERTTRGD